MTWRAALSVLFLALGTVAAAQTLSDDQIRQILIEQSIAAYPGRCPCPYNLAKNGSQCGKRSAWSKAGGYAPLCYPDDITPEMIEQYRANQS